MLTQLGKRARALLGQEERQRDEPPKMSTFSEMQTVIQKLQQNHSLIAMNIHPEYTEFLHCVANHKSSGLLGMARHVKLLYTDTYFVNSPYIHPGGLSMDDEFDEIVQLWNYVVRKIAMNLNWKFGNE